MLGAFEIFDAHSSILQSLFESKSNLLFLISVLVVISRSRYGTINELIPVQSRWLLFDWCYHCMKVYQKSDMK